MNNSFLNLIINPRFYLFKFNIKYNKFNVSIPNSFFSKYTYSADNIDFFIISFISPNNLL